MQDTKLVEEIIEKCHKEVSESPESVSAFLATDLIASIIVGGKKQLQNYVLHKFLSDNIIEPLIENEDSLLRDPAKQGAYI